MTTQDKLIQVSKLYKTTTKQLLQLDKAYIVPTDKPNTFTTGFIASWDNLSVPEATLEAQLLNSKNKLDRYCIENGPEIDRVIPTKDGEQVINIQCDFEIDGGITLVSENIKCYVKGRYIAYFMGVSAHCTFELTGELRPIIVKNNGERIGLIMPINKR